MSRFDWRRGVQWLVLGLAVASMFGIVWQLSRPVQPGRAASRCPERLKELKDATRANGITQVASEAGSVPETLAAVDGQGKPVQGSSVLKFKFDAERGVVIRRQTFRLPPGANQVQAALINDFADVQRDRVLPAEAGQIVLGFQRRSAPGTVTLVACIDPDGPGALRPGRYVGAASVSASSGPSATLSIEVSAQDRRWWLVLAFAFGGGIAGIVVKLLADRQTIGDHVEVSLNPRAWTARTWVAFAAGVTTAIYSFLTIYADDPTFSAEFGTLWRVAAETFAGTLAAKALTDLAGPAANGKRTETVAAE
jgi:hypothetical protein